MHDTLGRVIQIILTDPVGNTTSWTYDALNRAIEETNELNDSRYFVYDAVGNLVERTDRNGRVREFVFDNLYRMTDELWYDNGSVVHTIAYEFDVLDRITGASDSQAVYAFAYDNLHRRTQVTHDLVGVTAMPVIATSSVFDAAGRRTMLAAEIGGVDDFVTHYSYAKLHRMTGIQQHGVSGGNAVAEKRIDFSYNAAGQRTGETNAAVDHLFGHTGREWDEDVNPQYHLGRWYDPAVGRWISEDPIGFAGGDGSLARYVGNRPTIATDPNGLWERFGSDYWHYLTYEDGWVAAVGRAGIGVVKVFDLRPPEGAGDFSEGIGKGIGKGDRKRSEKVRSEKVSEIGKGVRRSEKVSGTVF